MPDLPILTSPELSPTLGRLVDSLEMIDAHLDRPQAWQAHEVGGMYVRIEATDSLVSRGPDRREYGVAVHVFPRLIQGELHDHRWPFAVYPFGHGLPDATPLYEMPWEYGQQSGVMIVGARRPYALEETAVRHAVRGLRPHMSLIFADITAPPTRPNRLSMAPLTAAATEDVLAQARDAFRQRAR